MHRTPESRSLLRNTGSVSLAVLVLLITQTAAAQGQPQPAPADPAAPAPPPAQPAPAAADTPAPAQAEAPPPASTSTPAAATPAPAGEGATAPPAAGVTGAPPAPSATLQGTAGLEAKAAASDAEADAEAAAIEAALSSEQPAELTGDNYALSLYGFADFTYVHSFHPALSTYPYDSFFVGNLNLYAAADLGDNWRSMVEVRFMYLPHGAMQTSADGLTQTRVNTTTLDYTDLNRPVRWGGIEIERAWVEYSFHPLLTVRGGQWLTPYGIWNVDHGSPVIIGVRRPFIVGDALFPEHQTGLDVHGDARIGATRIGYHLTVSNGRGPIDTHQDLNDDKAIGGRLAAVNESPLGTISLGASAYRGKYTDRQQVMTFGLEGMQYTYPRDAAYKELSLGADLKWELGGFLLQSELISNDMAYSEGLRPVGYPAPGEPSGFLPDTRKWGWYGLTGYRLPWAGIMPFGGMEYYWVGRHNFPIDSAAFWGGLNVRPTPRVVLKGQYTHAWFPIEMVGFEDKPSYEGLDFQVAWSF